MHERISELSNIKTVPWMPILTRIFLKVDKVEEKIGSIVIPDSSRQKETVAAETGVVIYVGPNAFSGYGNGEQQIFPGERIRFIRHAGVIDTIDGEEYRTINDVDVLNVSYDDYIKRSPDSLTCGGNS